MSRDASNHMGKNTGENADRDIRKNAGSGARTAASTVVGPMNSGRTSSWPLRLEPPRATGTTGLTPGKGQAFWPSFKRMVGLRGAYRVSLMIVALAAVGTVVLAVLAPDC